LDSEVTTGISDLASLAPYAIEDSDFRARQFAEPPPAYRSEFQRDRDRIVHSTAFRKLIYKTQVFVNHEGDLYRTRLTHSLEVAQIARTIARALRVNETLTEAISLAHDLGHTPFGHAGQDALNECMRPYGGFEHNLQSLRVIDVLEEQYADFPGLNLTFDTREGILKHCSLNNARTLGALGERFIRREQPSLEAQIANLADEIAYNNHDVDDGLRAGLLTIDGLREVEIFCRHHDTVSARYPELSGKRLVHEIVRRMIAELVSDVIEATQAGIATAKITSAKSVRARSELLVVFSASLQTQHIELKRYLNSHLYRHYRVLRMTTKAREVVQSLFNALFDTPELMPPEYASNADHTQQQAGDSGRARVVADYIAGMTDRYAILEHSRLFNPRERT
jgi:dGTPase